MIRYVHAGADPANTPGNALSWEKACNDLQAVIDVSEADDSVFVAAGIYSGGFRMKNGVQLFGGFKSDGSESTSASRTAAVNDRSAGSSSVLDGGNSQRVLTQPAEFDLPTVCDGFVIRKGMADDGAGAYLLRNGILRNCIVTENMSGGFVSNEGVNGGAVYGGKASRIEGCLIKNNTSYYTAGVHLEDDALMVNSTVAGNTKDIGTPVYRVGDIYPLNASGNSIQGVVFWADETGRHGWIVGLQDYTGEGFRGDYCKWAPGMLSLQGLSTITNLTEAMQDTCGWTNTLQIRTVTNHSSDYATGKVDISKGWYLPACGQLNKLIAVLPEINVVLGQIGNEATPVSPSGRYWSSTLYNDAFAWMTDFVWCSLSPSNMISSYGMHIRPVRSF